MFVMDKLLGGLVIVIVMLFSCNVYQHVKYKSTVSVYKLTVEKAERHIDNLQADYTHKLDTLNQKSLSKQNEILQDVRLKEMAHVERVKKIEKERVKNEKVIKSLNVMLNNERNKLLIASRKATARAKANSSSRTNLSSLPTSAKNRPETSGSKSSEEFLDTQQKVVEELHSFNRVVVDDFTSLQVQCKALNDSVNKKPSS